MHGEIITVCGIQLDCNGGNESTLKNVEKYIAEAFKYNSDIDLIVLPEQFVKPQCGSSKYNKYNESFFVNWLKSVAKNYKVNVIGGSFARFSCDYVSDNGKNEAEKPTNVCYVINRNGEIVGNYEKIHLFDAFNVKESDEFSSGDRLGIFSLDIGKVGVWICYDTRFPEISRALSLRGADLFCVPAAFYKPNSDQWEIILKSSSIMNVTPVIGVNQIGDRPDCKGFFGRSMAIDAKGIIIGGISDKEGYFVTQIDKSYTNTCRQVNPELKNRRIDLYRKWL